MERQQTRTDRVSQRLIHKSLSRTTSFRVEIARVQKQH